MKSKNWLLWMMCLLISVMCLLAPNSLAAAPEQVNSGENLLRMEAQIVEVELLKDPLGSAVYTVKNLSSGETVRLYADRYRTLVQVGGSPKKVADILGGEKATIVYRKPASTAEMPEIVFARVSESYYI